MTNTLQLQKSLRESGLELYRIIGMFLIVAHHYVVNSGMAEWQVRDRLEPVVFSGGRFKQDIGGRDSDMFVHAVQEPRDKI